MMKWLLLVALALIIGIVWWYVRQWTARTAPGRTRVEAPTHRGVAPATETPEAEASSATGNRGGAHAAERPGDPEAEPRTESP